MSINRYNFLCNVGNSEPHEGFRVNSQQISLHSVRDANGLVLTTGTTPHIDAAETNGLAITVDSGNTDAGIISWVVPQDYDSLKDEVKLEFLAESAGDTDTPAIDAAMYRKRPGAALSADLDPTISSSIPDNSTGSAWVSIDASDLDLQAGDVVTFVGTTEAHATDDVTIYGIRLTYKSTLAFADESDR